ncbi:MAG: hypothetical protein ACT4OH_07660 [Methylophilaceae bacterium]
MNIKFQNILFAGFLSLFFNFATAKDGIIYKTASNISFVNGGIGEEQATNIRRIANHFSLHLLFSGGNEGGWLADVSVLILDGNRQTIFSKKQGGPLLYIDLPTGDYQIIGRYNGDRQSKRITLTGEKSQRVILNWKDELSGLEPIIQGEE